MAYNNGFPATYQPMYYAPQYQVPQYHQAQQQTVQMVPQAQRNVSGFIRVQNENEARMYPVDPGSSVTFINENAPYCYTKTVDMYQLDRPKFEKYRFVKEDDSSTQPNIQPNIEYATKQEMNALQEIVDDLKARILQQANERKEKTDA